MRYSLRTSESPLDLPGETLRRVTVASYEAEEIIQNFQALLDTLDFKAELVEVGVGRFQFRKRKKALREFTALTIALWGIALHRSFPNNAQVFFEQFRATAPLLAAQSVEAQRLNTRLNIYVDLLLAKKDTDFLPVAQYFAEVFALRANDTDRLRLKLSLRMRSLYKLIFNRLV